MPIARVVLLSFAIVGAVIYWLWHLSHMPAPVLHQALPRLHAKGVRFLGESAGGRAFDRVWKLTIPPPRTSNVNLPNPPDTPAPRTCVQLPPRLFERSGVPAPSEECVSIEETEHILEAIAEKI